MMRAMNVILAAAIVVSVAEGAAAERKEIAVKTDEEVRAALSGVTPGITIRVAPGLYRNWYLATYRIEGTEEAPIIIEGADPNDLPIIDCRKTGQWKNEGIHLSGAKYVVLRNLLVRNSKDNGILFAAGGGQSWKDLGRDRGNSHHIRIENCSILNANRQGNHDSIKLAGIEYFTVRNCWIEGWGGSGIDANGSRCGVIEDNVFVCSRGTKNNSGIVLKGGGDSFLIQRNYFKNASMEQAVRIGDPQSNNVGPGRYAISGVEVAGNRFVGGATPVGWLSSDGGDVHHNTIVLPQHRFMRAWGRFDCGGPSFRNNLIVFDSSMMKPKGYRVMITTTPPEAIKKFSFSNNAWFEVNGQSSEISAELPTPEKAGVYGVDPKLDSLDSPTVKMESEDERLRGIGADAYEGPVLTPTGYGWSKTCKTTGPTYGDPKGKRGMP